MVIVQVTVSGHDFNGFVWENVFYLQTEITPPSTADYLDNTLEWVHGTLITEMSLAMSSQNVITDIAAKLVNPGSSYTLHKTENINGARDVDQDSGAIAGVIKWYPAEGAQTGRNYITGVGEGDYLNDFIAGPYSALLDDLKDAFLNLSGTDFGTVWLFVIYNKKTAATQAVIRGEVVNKCGVLSKRVRA